MFVSLGRLGLTDSAAEAISSKFVVQVASTKAALDGSYVSAPVSTDKISLVTSSGLAAQVTGNVLVNGELRCVRHLWADCWSLLTICTRKIAAELSLTRD